MRTVSELAALAGVSVRTLHYYDEVGLLAPATRTDAGYRLYGDVDARRLHEILFWRSLGFPLEEIKALLDDPRHDPVEAMSLLRSRLATEADAVHRRIAALDAAIARASSGPVLTDDELRDLFEGFDVAADTAEGEAQWGDTDAWAEAKRRTSRYNRADWAEMRAAQDALGAKLAVLCHAGTAVDAPEAREAALAHRAHLERWFYAVPADMHVALGRMYVEDPRFAATYDAITPGLAVWLRDAIEALHQPARRTL